MTRLRRLAIAMPIAAIAATALASPAAATTGVLADGNNLLIVGDDTSNVVSVDPLTVLPGTELRVIEVGKPLSVVQGCTLEPGFNNRADCIEVPRIVATLAGGPDVLTADGFVPVQAFGGAGQDQILGSETDDMLEGNGGNDMVMGDAGNDLISDGNRVGTPGGIGGDDRLEGGTGDDRLDAGPLPGGGTGADTLNGQAGFDTVDYSVRTAPVVVTEGDGLGDGESGEGDDVENGERILGGSAGDSLTGADEANTLSGGRGDDTLDGSGGADVLEGGAGTDTVTYPKRVTPVTANLDGEPGDGADGENDTIATDVENLSGGYEADRLTGSSGANALTGGAGGDSLEGAGGDDSLAGDDGNDALAGASGDDSVAGGDGDDTIDPGTGSDTVDAGPGADVVRARDDSRDTIACGAGDDTVVADPNDSVAADCEHVDRGAGADPGDGTGPGGGSGSVDQTGPALLLPARVQLGRTGAARVRVGCPAAEGSGGCRAVRLTVLVRGKRVGSARVPRIGGGRASTLRLRLKGRTPKRVSLSASAADAAGNRASSRRRARIARLR